MFTLYLTEEFGFTDQQVGTMSPIVWPCCKPDCLLRVLLQTGVLYGLWGCAITAFGFMFGGIVDWLGK